MKNGRRSLFDHAYQAADGDPAGALLYAVRATRWQLVTAGVLTPEPDEVIPAEVWRARRDRQAKLAA